MHGFVFLGYLFSKYREYMSTIPQCHFQIFKSQLLNITLFKNCILFELELLSITKVTSVILRFIYIQMNQITYH